MHIKKYSNDDQQYEKLTADLYNNFKDIVLPPEYANFVQNNSIQLLIRLARYKFVSRMIRPRDRVLEIGSGSGLGATFLGQHCNSVTGIEIKSREVEEARSINRRDNVDFKLVNFFDYSVDEKFDAILMDIQMPEMDGLEATKRIREIPDNKNLPIIALTANAMDEDEQMCRLAGMNGFITKPIDAEKLFKILSELI